jgi:hypothetical protein
MAGLVGLTITKSLRWQAKDEEYDNTYYYETPDGVLSPAELADAINIVQATEKAVHGLNVNFKRGRIWSAGGTKEENITLALVDLSGTGTQIGARIFGEAAVLIEWECDRLNIDGRKVYLKKFLRIGSVVGNMDAEVAQGREGMTEGMMNPFKSYADFVQRIQPLGGAAWNLIAPSRRKTKRSLNGRVNPFLRSREFRRN